MEVDSRSEAGTAQEHSSKVSKTGRIEWPRPEAAMTRVISSGTTNNGDVVFYGDAGWALSGGDYQESCV